MLQRILFSLVLLLSILFMPLWLSLILVISGALYFSMFWEGVVLFLLSDLLYGSEGAGYFNTIFISTIIALIILITTELLKKKLKFYPLVKN